jgi:hypothetical protein
VLIILLGQNEIVLCNTFVISPFIKLSYTIAENIIKMEPRDNENCVQENQVEESHIPLEPQNINIEIYLGLDTLRSLMNDLWRTRVPGRESFSTSFHIVVRSIASPQGKLTYIYEYEARMFDLYRTGLDRNQVRDLGISKQDLMFIFIYPRSRQQPLVTKKGIYIDWCIHAQILHNAWIGGSWYLMHLPAITNMFCYMF